MTHADPEWFVNSVERRLKLRSEARSLEESYATRREHYDAISDWEPQFVELLSVTEVRHRCGLGDPNPSMLEADELANRLAILWRKGNAMHGIDSPNSNPLTPGGWTWAELPQRVDVIEFRFGVAALLGLLVNEELSPAILEVVPKVGDWRDDEPFAFINFPDAGLVEILQTGQEPQGWADMLEFGTRGYGRSLLQESMECYAKIILASKAGEWDDAVRAVEHAQDLFDSRTKLGDCDEFDSWEHPLKGNPLHIDLRLSALMRYCFRDNPSVLDPLESVHRWRT